MLKCWDSDPEDRPSFTKIGSTISRALETMSEYLDISLVSDEAKVLAKLSQSICTLMLTTHHFALVGSLVSFCNSLSVLL